MEGYPVMQGVVVYLLLAAYMLLGGVSFWNGYRFFEATLIVVTAALLVRYVAKAPT